MIALTSFLAFLGIVAVASLIGKLLRRERKRQTRPVRTHLYVVRDERADITEATRRAR